MIDKDASISGSPKSSKEAEVRRVFGLHDAIATPQRRALVAAVYPKAANVMDLYRMDAGAYTLPYRLPMPHVYLSHTTRVLAPKSVKSITRNTPVFAIYQTQRKATMSSATTFYDFKPLDSTSITYPSQVHHPSYKTHG